MIASRHPALPSHRRRCPLPSSAFSTGRRRSRPVLIAGESRTGKEVLARAIHAMSGRRGAMVPVNCGAIPPNLVEAELFGHKKGAFSGADADRPGLVKASDGGTLFLDEIGDLPPPAQAALLLARPVPDSPAHPERRPLRRRPRPRSSPEPSEHDDREVVQWPMQNARPGCHLAYSRRSPRRVDALAISSEMARPRSAETSTERQIAPLDREPIAARRLTSIGLLRVRSGPPVPSKWCAEQRNSTRGRARVAV